MAHLVLLHSSLGSTPSPDQQESLDIAYILDKELQQLGHRVTPLPFTLDLQKNADLLRETNPDLVFNLVDDIDADDSLHYLAAHFLQHLGLRFTGASADILFITSHKLLTKRLLRAAGVPTPGWVSVEDAGDFVPGVPYILKPVNHDASIGIDGNALVTVDSVEELRHALRVRQERTGWEYFGERFISGREVWVSLIGPAGEPQVFPPAEMKFQDYEPGQEPQYVTYRAKWERDSFEYHHLKSTYAFAPGEAALVARLQEIARQTWQALFVRGYGRIDLRIDAQGQPWVLDVNANPYLPFHPGGILEAAQQAGWDFSRLLSEVIDQAAGPVQK